MSHRSLRLAAARFSLGLAGSAELVNAADDALNDGVYSYNLGELGTFRQPTLAECAPLFAAALRELEIAIPDPPAAIRELLEHHVVRLSEGATTVDNIISELYLIEVAFRYNPPVVLPPGALEPLRPFIDWYYAVEEADLLNRHSDEQGHPPPYASSTDPRAAATSAAEDWCRKRWGPAMNPSWLTTSVRALASGVRAEKAFDRLPILADALQEAGCQNEEILDHLRARGPHLRCCFVVDLLVGLGAGGASP
jgi:hypothetical protein